VITSGKVWGETTPVFGGSTYEVHHIKVKKGGYCSEHRHHHRNNFFYVLSGELVVAVWKEEKLIDYTRLKAGQGFCVTAGYWHQFTAKTAVEALEIYFLSAVDASDIDRRTQGGLGK
jgi:mannose-6-phosphate isomerase-like protein (cupin superfamily)